MLRISAHARSVSDRVAWQEWHGNMATASQMKVLDSSKRYLRWAKLTYPREFNCLILTWVETLRLPHQLQVNTDPVSY